MRAIVGLHQRRADEKDARTQSRAQIRAIRVKHTGGTLRRHAALFVVLLLAAAMNSINAITIAIAIDTTTSRPAAIPSGARPSRADKLCELASTAGRCADGVEK